MIPNRNNHVFKGHKTLLGAKFVTYGEVELPLRYDIFSQSQSGFDWGHTGPAAQQLSFAMLYQLTNEEIAKEHTIKFTHDVVRLFNSRDWVLSAADVLKWIKENVPNISELYESKKAHSKEVVPPKKSKEKNVVKEICKELQITQKQLAEILEVPEGTVSSWAVKNEIPRLGKKAIEFYTSHKKSETIIQSYKQFISLLNDA
jgi:DNA-binding transcriptional regulator YiaG